MDNHEPTTKISSLDLTVKVINFCWKATELITTTAVVMKDRTLLMLLEVSYLFIAKCLGVNYSLLEYISDDFPTWEGGTDWNAVAFSAEAMEFDVGGGKKTVAGPSL